LNKKVETPKKKVDYGKKALEITQVIANLGKRGAISVFDFFREPSQIPTKLKSIWQMMKDEAHHYWVGTKLLWAEFKTANEILSRVLKGHMMTRRERLQLVRTTQDLLRLVPFSVFVIVPFMELLLPLAIKLFPNMLPSTFEDSLKKEENLKKELAMRLGVASFFIETIRNMAEKKQKDGDEEATASEVRDSSSYLLSWG
jgi:LETM1 and EF-hand domain-containing protein 1